MSKTKKNATIWLLFAIAYFLIFALEIENDRDFWTWVWLLSSIISFLGSLRNYIAADRHGWLIEKTKHADIKVEKLTNTVRSCQTCKNHNYNSDTNKYT